MRAMIVDCQVQDESCLLRFCVEPSLALIEHFVAISRLPILQVLFPVYAY